MKDEKRIQLMSKFITGNDLQKQISNRKNDNFKITFKNDDPELKRHIKIGWEVDAIKKTVTRLTKAKPLDINFEDKVWALFASLGFTTMNEDRKLQLPYDKKNLALTQQIDVFAKDDETILLIECKTSSSNKVGDFKKELEAMKSKKQGLINTIRYLFPNNQFKFKYILATKNLHLNENDQARLDKLQGIHFNEEMVDYYFDLHSQIGLSARYQLLGNLFAGEIIHEIENAIPAIEGKMGGHTYFSFSIEPEKLLKIGYVLHRNKANQEMMPTYQRIIKKNRLKDIYNFIDVEKGFFPNSIIVNIATEKGKPLKFDRSSLQAPNAISKIGILHLPKRYKSAYIIDGQHRLYGYSNSKYKSTNTIPVVAFVDLSKSEQVKLFMQINENQKAVSKDLRNTLNSDLLWDSENLLEQMSSLRSRIAITLGENRKSPLYGKVSIGEDKKIISTQHIAITLNKTNFLGKVKKYEIEQKGTFYSGDLDKALIRVTDLLMRTFEYVKSNVGDKWDEEGSVVLCNRGFYGIVVVLNDIINHLIAEGVISESSPIKQIHEETCPYMDCIIHFFNDIDMAQTLILQKAYGTGGDAIYWRTFQKVLRENYEDMHLDGLEEHLKKEEKENNEAAFRYIREIETYLKDRVREKLEVEFGKSWFKKGVPAKIYTETSNLAAQKNREIDNEDDEKEPWDCLHLVHYREIISQNWQKLFEKKYTRPNELKINGGKEAKTKWLVELNRIRNENDHTYYVTPEELSYIEEIHDWLIKNSAN